VLLAAASIPAAAPAMDAPVDVPAAATPAASPNRRAWEFAEDGVTFDARFATARLDDCERTAFDTYAVTIRPENKPINPSAWFAFTVGATQLKTIVVDLKCDDAPLRYRPKISVDGRNWITLPEEAFTLGAKTGEGRLRLEIGPEPLWIAAQEIVSAEHLDAWSRTLERLPFVTRTEIGRSVQGRPLHQLEIGEPTAGAFFVVIGRQHPPETTGTLALMGFVEALAGDTALARDFRKKYCALVVPHLNPDGIAHGHWRHNAGGVDLNRDWGPFTQPETRAVRDRILALRDRGRIYFLIDFHSTFFDVFYTKTDDQPTSPPGFIKQWVAAIHARFPDYQVKRSATASTKQANAVNWAYTTLGIPAVTYEIGDNTGRAALRRLATGAAEETMTLLLQAKSVAAAPVGGKPNAVRDPSP
jgi:hypothetical protein